MGILDKLFKKERDTSISKYAKYDNTEDQSNDNKSKNVSSSKNTLEEDIVLASEWIVKALNSTGYQADYTLESMKEIDRFFSEQSSPTGIISKNRGCILFAIASYIGQTAIKLSGGQWITDDNDPQGEVYITVKLSSGATFWPVNRCMRRYQNGKEDSIYVYLYSILNGSDEEIKRGCFL